MHLRRPSTRHDHPDRPHRHRPVVAIAVLAAVAALAGLVPAGAAAAATGPLFDDNGGTHSRGPAGVAYPTTVNGTYVPLPMVCGGERRVLWYGPGGAPDALWRHVELPADGPVGHESAAVSISGTYQPFTGDFDGDGCEDVFWYAPGSGADFVWFLDGDAAVESVPVRVNGTYTPLVGDFNGGDTFDDIFWYAPGRTAETIWVGTEGRGSFVPAAAKQVSGTYAPVVAIDDSSILWFRSGSGADVLWRDVMAGTATVGADSPTTINGTYTPHNLGGTALLHAPGAAADRAVVASSEPVGSAPVTLRTLSGDLGGTFVISTSTARAGFGVLHAPGPAQDYLVDARGTGVWTRNPDGVDGFAPDDHMNTIGVADDGSAVLLQSGATNLVETDGNEGYDDAVVWLRDAGEYRRAPLGHDGNEPDGYTEPVAISGDGSKVLLISASTNLVPGDTNGRTDLYVWDLLTDTYERQPLGVGDQQSNSYPTQAVISADGSTVAFTSAASNLVAGDVGTVEDVFVWDLATDTYQRQPLGVGDAQPDDFSRGADISADGSLVLLSSAASNLVPGDDNAARDVFLWDVAEGTYERQPDGLGGADPDSPSFDGVMSGDGATVVLDSDASNLFPGDTNGRTDAVVWYTGTGTYEPAPAGIDGARPDGQSSVLALSADGSTAVILTLSANLVDGADNGEWDLFAWDLSAGSYQRAPGLEAGITIETRWSGVSVTGDGRFVVGSSTVASLTPDDLNEVADVMVWDRRPS
jgi:hypothetical protein